MLAADLARRGKARPYVATTEQVWALHDAMPERLRTAVLLGAFDGLRTAEACGLRVANVDFMRGVVRLAVQYPAAELKKRQAGRRGRTQTSPHGPPWVRCWRLMRTRCGPTLAVPDESPGQPGSRA